MIRIDETNRSRRNDILNFVKDIETLISEDRYNNDSIEDFKKKEFPNQIEKLEDSLKNNTSENDPIILKTEFPDKWNCLRKNLAYLKNFSVVSMVKPINNIKKENFFSKFENASPSEQNIERTKGLFKLFNIKKLEKILKNYN